MLAVEPVMEQAPRLSVAIARALYWVVFHLEKEPLMSATHLRQQLQLAEEAAEQLERYLVAAIASDPTLRPVDFLNVLRLYSRLGGDRLDVVGTQATSAALAAFGGRLAAGRVEQQQVVSAIWLMSLLASKRLPRCAAVSDALQEWLEANASQLEPLEAVWVIMALARFMGCQNIQHMPTVH